MAQCDQLKRSFLNQISSLDLSVQQRENTSTQPMQCWGLIISDLRFDIGVTHSVSLTLGTPYSRLNMVEMPSIQFYIKNWVLGVGVVA